MDYLNDLLRNLTSGDYLINALIAILLLIVGIFIAKLLKKLTAKIIKKSGLDDKLKSDNITLSKFISKLVYLLVMIFVFTLVLGRLGLTSALDPLKNMLDDFLGFIPKIVGAGLVGYIGYMLATIIAEFVGMSGDTIRKFLPKLKISTKIDVVNILKKIVFIFIFIPLLIVALNILGMDAISIPATEMLSSFMQAIPKIATAAIILIAFTIGARFLSGLIKDILNGMNMNATLQKIQLDKMVGNVNVVNLIGNIVYFFIVLFGITTAVEKLEFSQLSEILATVNVYGGKILFGLVILVIGNWIASIVYKNMAVKENAFLASIVRMAIIAIFLAIGLNTMGIADEIINLAFGLTLGTIALTIVLSFGLGGREAAGQHMKKILNKFDNKID
ncbi:mechanosensitive ion channel [Dokdonia sp. PRO95]|uniref:mechanosensitive ion channel n=1 Tax=unclassified Dokdonia TaxID=2615033 RepID=UPI00054DE5E7|nr:mechanosensitive ion channel [Dokdonia sp. PRO95]